MAGKVVDTLTETVIGLSMKVHRTLGPGFLESVYRKALAYELEENGLKVEQEKKISVYYRGQHVGEFSADLFVGDQLIVELKAVDSLCKAHEVQTVNYLTAARLDVGLLLNFGAATLEIRRKYRRRTSGDQ